MVSNSDRQGFIGASDTHYVMGNWATDTFAKWWRQKQGLDNSTFTSIYTETGSAFEHKITEFLGILDIDQQETFGRLRVNLDGIKDGVIQEIKTHKKRAGWKPSKDYFQQVQVQMFLFKIPSARIIAYELLDEDYENWDNPIDEKRIDFFYYDYDEEFIKSYLPRFCYLSNCLDEGLFPKKEKYESEIQMYQLYADEYRTDFLRGQG